MRNLMDKRIDIYHHPDGTDGIALSPHWRMEHPAGSIWFLIDTRKPDGMVPFPTVTPKAGMPLSELLKKLFKANGLLPRDTDILKDCFPMPNKSRFYEEQGEDD